MAKHDVAWTCLAHVSHETLAKHCCWAGWCVGHTGGDALLDMSIVSMLRLNDQVVFFRDYIYEYEYESVTCTNVCNCILCCVLYAVFFWKLKSHACSNIYFAIIRGKVKKTAKGSTGLDKAFARVWLMRYVTMYDCMTLTWIWHVVKLDHVIWFYVNRTFAGWNMVS